MMTPRWLLDQTASTAPPLPFASNLAWITAPNRCKARSRSQDRWRTRRRRCPPRPRLVRATLSAARQSGREAYWPAQRPPRCVGVRCAASRTSESSRAPASVSSGMVVLPSAHSLDVASDCRSRASRWLTATSSCRLGGDHLLPPISSFNRVSRLAHATSAASAARRAARSAASCARNCSGVTAPRPNGRGAATAGGSHSRSSGGIAPGCAAQAASSSSTATRNAFPRLPLTRNQTIQAPPTLAPVNFIDRYPTTTMACQRPGRRFATNYVEIPRRLTVIIPASPHGSGILAMATTATTALAAKTIASKAWPKVIIIPFPSLRSRLRQIRSTSGISPRNLLITDGPVSARQRYTARERPG